jgi:hypothetical protein
MHIRVTSTQRDRLEQLAQHFRVSTPALVRFACKRLLKAADLSRPAKP